MSRSIAAAALVLSVLVYVPARPGASRQAKPNQAPAAEPSREAQAEFLRTAKVVRSRQLGKGVTNPWRLTLTDGVLTHDAAFQSIDEHKVSQTFADGHTELNFVDSYHYNIAAFGVAGLLGLDQMMPVTLERTWNGKRGAISWWIDNAMDERDRLQRKLEPPASAHWNDQMFRLRVFGKLVADTDRNLGNVLIGPDWTLWMIDFTRAFRLSRDLPYPGDLARCDRALLAAMRTLDGARVKQAVGEHLRPPEIESLLARRTLIVEHFDKLIAAKGEANVLY